MELTERNAGERLTLRAGEPVTLALTETPTTGYRWHADDTAGLELLGDTYDGPTEPRGAAGTRRLTFTPRRTGPLRLRVALRRSWESTEADEFVVDLEVADAEGR
ncbi:MAG TPA: protease inhibitor I42 family protein [Jatrophihabitans sp.]|uniref:protease inhibitor I42 family protein n=1 Tax=Jatrophihabitans sp. TaxID=1932789 RepID=UPI002E014ECF|nr:protease inhibitor I42 family protein [Jatrophihabitans sp.]